MRKKLSFPRRRESTAYRRGTKSAINYVHLLNIPIILGQLNFFMEFDVCFYGSQLAFELSPKMSRGQII